MAALLIPELNPETLGRLEDRAKQHGRSLEGEARVILESAVGLPKTDREPTEKLTLDRARELAAEVRRSFGDRVFSDSAELIREDRDR